MHSLVRYIIITDCCTVPLYCVDMVYGNISGLSICTVYGVIIFRTQPIHLRNRMGNFSSTSNNELKIKGQSTKAAPKIRLLIQKLAVGLPSGVCNLINYCNKLGCYFLMSDNHRSLHFDDMHVSSVRPTLSSRATREQHLSLHNFQTLVK